MIYIYACGILLLILIIIRFYIKIKWQFWSIQPVFHIYNIFYWFFPPGIINENFPKTKYFNCNNISTEFLNPENEIKIKKIINFLQKNYLKDKEIKYFPKIENFNPYFIDQNQSFLSIYHKNNNIVGCITSRPLYVYINNNEMYTYYVDNLCIDKNERKKGIATQLIQTHEHHQRHNNKKNIVTSLFKREGHTNIIMPLVIYNTYIFDMSYWKYNTILNPTISIVQINPNNFNLLVNFLAIIKKKFKCYIITTISTLLELIKTNNIYIYCLIQNHEIIACYFFRNATTVYKNKKCLECFCTINNCLDETVFLYGFLNVYKIFIPNYSILYFENISDTNIIIDLILKKHTPISLSPTSYYFYNFAIHSVKEKNTCIII